MSVKTKQARQSLYMDELLKQLLEDRAKRNKRSFNKEVIYILESAIEQEQKQSNPLHA